MKVPLRGTEERNWNQLDFLPFLRQLDPPQCSGVIVRLMIDVNYVFHRCAAQPAPKEHDSEELPLEDSTRWEMVDRFVTLEIRLELRKCLDNSTRSLRDADRLELYFAVH